MWPHSLIYFSHNVNGKKEIVSLSTTTVYIITTKTHAFFCIVCSAHSIILFIRIILHSFEEEGSINHPLFFNGNGALANENPCFAILKCPGKSHPLILTPKK